MVLASTARALLGVVGRWSLLFILVLLLALTAVVTVVVMPLMSVMRRPFSRSAMQSLGGHSRPPAGVARKKRRKKEEKKLDGWTAGYVPTT